MPSGRIGFISTPRASSSTVKATCERKGNELHVTIPQQQGARAVTANGFIAPGMAVNPLALQAGYGPQFRMIPGRTSRALTMGWTALPIPYPTMRKVQIAPTVAMTEGKRASFLQRNMFGVNPRMGMYGMAPYGMQGFGMQGFGMPMGAGGVMPVGYAQGTHLQTMQTAQLRDMLARLQGQPTDNPDAEGTERVRKRAEELEKKVNQLLDILEERNSAKGSAATDGVSGSGHSPAFATAENRTAANIEQMSGMIPRSAYRTSSDVELWPHSPQNQRRYR
jgi:hypothetical protein